MATTTNYSWTTPDDTALVKDGAAAIRSLGTAIDSTVFTNAGAAVAKATVDAKGDLIAGTADNTVARLAVGANDTVLIADSSTATGLKWAAPASGGMTLLSTTTLSGATTTISSISQSYTRLFLVITGVSTTVDYARLTLKPNGSANITSTSAAGQTAYDARNDANFAFFDGNNWDNDDTNNSFVCEISNYTSSTNYKPIKAYGSFIDNGANERSFVRYGQIKTSSTITSLEFLWSSAVNFSAGTVLLYGVK